MTTKIETVHISSLVIHCLPDKLGSIVINTAKMKNTEVAAHDACGKFVAILETNTEHEILAIIEKIQALPGVLTTTMVYHELDC